MDAPEEQLRIIVQEGTGSQTAAVTTGIQPVYTTLPDNHEIRFLGEALLEFPHDRPPFVRLKRKNDPVPTNNPAVARVGLMIWTQILSRYPWVTRTPLEPQTM